MPQHPVLASHSLLVLLFFGPLLFSQSTFAINQITLQEYIHLALLQSDQAYGLKDSLSISKMNVASAAHEFDVSWVPLARIGTFTGQGQQKLGMEARKKLFSGLTVATGMTASRTESDSVELTNSHNMRAYVKFSQGLFRNWGERYNRAHLTQAELDGQRQGLLVERGKQDIILGAVRNYYDVLLAKLVINTSEQALQRSRGILEAARSRQAAGLVSKVDVYRAEVSALDAENALEEKYRSLRNAMEALHEQVGLSGTDRLQINTDIQEFVPVLPSDWQNEVLNLHPDWLAYQVQKDTSALNIYKAERDLLPDLALNVVLEQKGLGDSIEEASRMDTTDWSIQLELRSTFDNFNEKSRLSHERIQATQLQRKGSALKRKIQRNVRAAMEDIQVLERRHHINEQKLKHAWQGQDLANIRYERGLSDNLDLLDAQAAYFDAELEILRTRVSYNVGAIKLGHALGILTQDWLQLALSPDRPTTEKQTSNRSDWTPDMEQLVSQYSLMLNSPKMQKP